MPPRLLRRNLEAPLFYTPPTLEGYFEGKGGGGWWGCINFGPVQTIAIPTSSQGELPHCPIIGCVPTTPDPNASSRTSRYKWEPYRDAKLVLEIIPSAKKSQRNQGYG